MAAIRRSSMEAPSQPLQRQHDRLATPDGDGIPQDREAQLNRGHEDREQPGREAEERRESDLRGADQGTRSRPFGEADAAAGGGVIDGPPRRDGPIGSKSLPSTQPVQVFEQMMRPQPLGEGFDQHHVEARVEAALGRERRFGGATRPAGRRQARDGSADTPVKEPLTVRVLLVTDAATGGDAGEPAGVECVAGVGWGTDVGSRHGHRRSPDRRIVRCHRG